MRVDERSIAQPSGVAVSACSSTPPTNSTVPVSASARARARAENIGHPTTAAHEIEHHDQSRREVCAGGDKADEEFRDRVVIAALHGNHAENAQDRDIAKITELDAKRRGSASRTSSTAGRRRSRAAVSRRRAAQCPVVEAQASEGSLSHMRITSLRRPLNDRAPSLTLWSRLAVGHRSSADHPTAASQNLNKCCGGWI